jgi:hypothetical protein
VLIITTASYTAQCDGVGTVTESDYVDTRCRNDRICNSPPALIERVSDVTVIVSATVT